MTPEERAATLCYIGRTVTPTKHYPIVGTVVCAAVDDTSLTRETAKEVAKWIRDGLAVERAPVWWVRLHFGTTEQYRVGDVSPP